MTFCDFSQSILDISDLYALKHVYDIYLILYIVDQTWILHRER